MQDNKDCLSIPPVMVFLSSAKNRLVLSGMAAMNVAPMDIIIPLHACVLASDNSKN